MASPVNWFVGPYQCSVRAIRLVGHEKTKDFEFFFRRSDEADKQSADKNRPMRKSMIKNRQQPEV
jgi:hypothetical protein